MAGRLRSSDAIKLAPTLCRWLRPTHCLLCKYLAMNPSNTMSGQVQLLSALQGLLRRGDRAHDQQSCEGLRRTCADGAQALDDIAEKNDAILSPAQEPIIC